MRRKALVAATLALLLAAGSAQALKMRAGDLLVIGDGGFKPKALPRDHDAPITLHGGGRISTLSGALPPILKTISFEFDRHGSVQTAGLPVCRRTDLVATDVPAARRNCPGAIVGKGFGHAIVQFPEMAPISVSSPITLFNGPKRHGLDTLFAHAYLEVGGPSTFIVPIVIERIHKGVYGYRTKAKIPMIAHGYGVPISGSLRIGRRWTFRGRRLSYVNARCATGHLQAYGEFGFDDGNVLTGTFFKPCKVRR
jgi:hypothetical protein